MSGIVWKNDGVKNGALAWNPFFEIAYYAGLGARNSMGFGMVEV